MVVRRAFAVPFYGEALARAGVSDDDVRGPEDVRRLPFTTKDDLRRNYPLGLLAVPRHAIARVHGSSGTTGKPTFVAYTKRDLETWSGLVARFLVAGGLRPDHLVHVAFGYGLFTGGFGLHYGIERVGTGVVPAGGGNTPRQVLLIRDLGAEVLVCTPSYALHIGEVARAEGLGPGDLPLRFGHFGGSKAPSARTSMVRGFGSSIRRPRASTSGSPPAPPSSPAPPTTFSAATTGPPTSQSASGSASRGQSPLAGGGTEVGSEHGGRAGRPGGCHGLGQADHAVGRRATRAIAAAFMLPRHVRVARTATIAASRSTIFTILDSFRQFNRWSPWFELDPEAKYISEGPAAGVGAKLTWAGNPQTLGSGYQAITASTPYGRIEADVDFGQGGSERSSLASPKPPR